MRLWPLTLLAGLAAMLAVAPARAANEGPPDPVAVMQAAILKACQASGPQEMDDLAVDLPGITPVGPRRGQRMIIGGWRKIYPLEIGDLTIDWLAPRGLLHHIRLQLDLDDQGTPLLYAMVARGCRVKMARRMEYGSDQRPQRVQILDAEFMPTGENEALDPPVPAAEDPGGIPVAVIDTGVNYTLDHIVTRLSRGPDGALAGYDFWDMDNRPFDANPHRSAFFPARHGTAVSSILLSEAPAAELLIYRYPRPDMSRFGTIIDRAAAGGARVVNLSMASFHAEDWVPFRRAMAKHPEMLFVVAAGNNRRNVDFSPVYPAAYRAPNLITVTTAHGDGALDKDANWGARSVDISVPGRNVPGIGYNGRRDTFTGSSYAAARVSALAICLLARDESQTMSEVRDAILALAERRQERKPLRHGFISEAALKSLTGCRQAKADVSGKAAPG